MLCIVLFSCSTSGGMSDISMMHQLLIGHKTATTFVTSSLIGRHISLDQSEARLTFLGQWESLLLVIITTTTTPRSCGGRSGRWAVDRSSSSRRAPSPTNILSCATTGPRSLATWRDVPCTPRELPAQPVPQITQHAATGSVPNEKYICPKILTIERFVDNHSFNFITFLDRKLLQKLSI